MAASDGDLTRRTAAELAGLVAGGEVSAAELIARHPDLDGIVVASDLMAAGTLKALVAAGRKVPDDVAVVGYDDVGVAERTDPPLTTVRNPIREMAEQATRLLLEQVDGERSAGAMRVIFPPSLVVRASA